MPSPITTEIYAIPLADRFVVYAPLRRVAFLANGAAVNLLHRLQQREVQPAGEDERTFLDLCERTHLTGAEGDRPVQRLGDGPFRPTEVTLFLTTRCNLRCTYCYASAGERGPADMDLATAQRGIDFVCRNALELGLPGFTVGYHGGGEPTVNWETLTGSFAYAEGLAREHGLRVQGAMATNGVLGPRKLDWIVSHLAGANLSIDGLPQVQDRQRPRANGARSSAALRRTLAAFDRARFPYGLRLTVTAGSVACLPESVAWLLAHSRPTQIQVEPVYALGRGLADGLAVEAQPFVEAYLEAEAVADEHGVRLFYSGARADTLTDRFCRSCGAGFSLTPGGLVSACYEAPGADYAFADPFIFGRYDEARGGFCLDEAKLARLRADTVETIPWCRDCFCKWHCAGDCRYKARHASGGGQFAGDARCEITRALTLAQILRKMADAGGSVWSEA